MSTRYCTHIHYQDDSYPDRYRSTVGMFNSKRSACEHIVMSLWKNIREHYTYDGVFDVVEFMYNELNDEQRERYEDMTLEELEETRDEMVKVFLKMFYDELYEYNGTETSIYSFLVKAEVSEIDIDKDHEEVFMCENSCWMK